MYFINDPVTADPDSPGIPAAQFFTAGRSWIFCERLDGFDYFILVRLGNFRQVFLRGFLNKDFIIQ